MTFVGVDEETFEDVDSFGVTIEGKALCTEDYFHVVAVVEWRVFVSSWANRLVLEEELLLVSQ